jgi:two-component system sensor histidine kinase BaeS
MRRIRTRLFATLLVATFSVVISMHFFTRWSFEKGFEAWLADKLDTRATYLAEVLAAQWEVDGNWDRLASNRRIWFRLSKAVPGQRHFMHPRQDDQIGKKMVREPVSALLLDADKRLLIGHLPTQDTPLKLYPVEVNDTIVGYLGIVPSPGLMEFRDYQFREQQYQNLVWLSLGATLLSALLAFIFAASINRPLSRIAGSLRALARGDYSRRITPVQRDELGQLCANVNDLAHTLDQAARSRQQWVADTSHELRTPLALMRAEIEALQDGVRPLTKESIDGLHQDVMQLFRLVEDLYELAGSDLGGMHYRKERLSPLPLIEDCCDDFRLAVENKGLQLTLESSIPRACRIMVDADRITQMLRNILTNSLRYTDAPGQIHVCAVANRSSLRLTIEDSAPGVTGADLDRLFERLYRVDASRSRNTGGSGLGLSICKNIVAAHDGQIRALPSKLGGVKIEIHLPVCP